MIECKDCQFYASSEISPDLQREYVCKRYPPNTSAIATPQGVLNISTFPGVASDGWCGEFKLRYAKLDSVVVFDDG